MGRRVPGWAGFVAAPVVVFLTICSYYAYTRHYRTASGNVASFPVDSAALQQSTDPEALLGFADHFYWLNNGPAAAPLYARAEKLFSARGDARNKLYAKVGRLRSEAQTMSFVNLSRFLNEQLQNSIVQTDKRLRLRCVAKQAVFPAQIASTYPITFLSSTAIRNWRVGSRAAAGVGALRPMSNASTFPEAFHPVLASHQA
jgi:hypothetical protein